MNLSHRKRRATNSMFEIYFKCLTLSPGLQICNRPNAHGNNIDIIHIVKPYADALAMIRYLLSIQGHVQLLIAAQGYDDR